MRHCARPEGDRKNSRIPKTIRNVYGGLERLARRHIIAEERQSHSAHAPSIRRYGVVRPTRYCGAA
jgi:hypothetical protein